MIDVKDLARYRAMSPAERLALAIELSSLAWAWLDVPDRASGERKWAVWNREHDRSNEQLVGRLKRMMEAEADPGGGHP
ncbi:MAG: hypothetical protein HZA54_03165 [Planctomycetes bacterium]|nr:hypothetical protein [Planctomycetota bacterium]